MLFLEPVWSTSKGVLNDNLLFTVATTPRAGETPTKEQNSVSSRYGGYSHYGYIRYQEGLTMTNYGGSQAEIVMRTFYKHKLRDPGGHTITDPVRAKAVAMREQEAADERGTEIRTFKGRSRRRPKLKK